MDIGWQMQAINYTLTNVLDAYIFRYIEFTYSKELELGVVYREFSWEEMLLSQGSLWWYALDKAQALVGIKL